MGASSTLPVLFLEELRVIGRERVCVAGGLAVSEHEAPVVGWDREDRRSNRDFRPGFRFRKRGLC
jgi:hypothetical protein